MIDRLNQQEVTREFLAGVSARAFERRVFLSLEVMADAFAREHKYLTANKLPVEKLLSSLRKVLYKFKCPHLYKPILASAKLSE